MERLQLLFLVSFASYSDEGLELIYYSTAGEILAQAVPQLERNIHPVVIISAFKRALADAIQIIEEISLPVDIDDDEAMYKLISSSIGTKFVSRWSELMCNLALKAVRTVTHEIGNGKKEVDIKRYARVEKVPGGEIEDSRVLDGVMLNKDITHPKMRRRIENPRIVLLDCSLEYKKGESQTNIEISKEEDWNRILQIEEEQVKAMCDAVLALKPDLVITEKGVSDLAQHYLLKGNVTALRRVRKSDNNRIARATGATIVNRVDDLTEEDVGLLCGLFEIEKIGDEYFTFLTKCREPKACTILLRGPSKDILNEIDRNLADAMAVARNVMFHPRLAPGGGATEMAVSVRLSQLAKGVEGVQQWPYRAVAEAMEVIPRTLVQNAGQSPVRVLTELRAKHAEGGSSWGIDGDTGKLVDMKEYGVWEPEAVKLQSIKTAIEVCFSSCYVWGVGANVNTVGLPVTTRGRHLQRQGSKDGWWWRRWWRGVKKWNGRKRNRENGYVRKADDLIERAHVNIMEGLKEVDGLDCNVM
jgi:T-complex protein 1 subunit gamma